MRFNEIYYFLKYNWDTCIVIFGLLIMWTIKINCVYNMLLKKWDVNTYQEAFNMNNQTLA